MLARLEALTRRVSDRLNPMLVKEVRQGLRTRSFVISFLLLLSACVVVSLVAGESARDANADELGMYVFFAYLTCYAFIAFLVLPITAHRAFQRERESEAWPVLQLTGLSARQVLRGKIASSLVQGALYASATTPFLFFSYFLQGIGLVTILLMMAATFAWQVFLITFAICMAALPDTKLGRSAAAGATGIFLPVSSLFVGSWIISFASMSRFGGPTMTTSDFAFIGAGALWFVGTLSALMFEVAAANLAPPSVNHAKGPRLVALVHLVGSTALLALAVPTHDWERAALAASIYGAIFCWIFGIASASVADGIPRAQRRITKARHLLRPGAVRGFGITLVLYLWTTGVSTALFIAADSLNSDWDVAMASVSASMLLLGVTVFVCKGLLPDVLGAPIGMRATGAALTSIVFVTAPITEVYELLDEPAVLAVAALVVWAAAHWVLTVREREAERKVDAARAGAPA